MPTLVCFHAHPDDEAIATGGLMALASDAGHRVVVVCATRGEQGEPQEGVLAPGEVLADRRAVELAEAAALLGADEPRFLDYEDSGMMGEPTNENPASFWQADHDEAVARLSAILAEVDADVLTIYDANGGYGHPDHIRVHTVGWAAARTVGVDAVYEAVINRDVVEELRAAAIEAGDDFDADDAEIESFGTPAVDIAWSVDVGAVLDRKRAAMAAHRSQIGPDTFFLSMPDAAFSAAFGREWFSIPGISGNGPPRATPLLPELLSG